jgi:hypothetical protein
VAAVGAYGTATGCASRLARARGRPAAAARDRRRPADPGPAAGAAAGRAERALREIHLAAADWAALETAASGNAATGRGRVAAVLPRDPDDDIDTVAAAELLDVGERRVRDLAAAGCFTARRVGGA